MLFPVKLPDEGISPGKVLTWIVAGVERTIEPVPMMRVRAGESKLTCASEMLAALSVTLPPAMPAKFAIPPALGTSGSLLQLELTSQLPDPRLIHVPLT